MKLLSLANWHRGSKESMERGLLLRKLNAEANPWGKKEKRMEHGTQERRWSYNLNMVF